MHVYRRGRYGVRVHRSDRRVESQGRRCLRRSSFSVMDVREWLVDCPVWNSARYARCRVMHQGRRCVSMVCVRLD